MVSSPPFLIFLIMCIFCQSKKRQTLYYLYRIFILSLYISFQDIDQPQNGLGSFSFHSAKVEVSVTLRCREQFVCFRILFSSARVDRCIYSFAKKESSTFLCKRWQDMLQAIVYIVLWRNPRYDGFIVCEKCCCPFWTRWHIVNPFFALQNNVI